MKQLMFIIGFLLGSFLLFSSFSLRETPQEPPRGEKGEKAKRQIRLEKIENGEKTVLDTVIESNQVFIWNGDTIGSAKELKWIMEEDFNMDSIHKNFEFRFFESDNDGENNDGENKFIFAPHPPHSPKAPQVLRLNKKFNGNVIDLGDPGIISYKKKKMSGGREKITIIRNEPNEKEFGQEVLIEIPEIPEPAVWMSEKSPEKVRSIKVIRHDDGKVEITEDENIKVHKKDGKVIIVRKKINDGTEEIELEIEENE
jgi:hypothetical protein